MKKTNKKSQNFFKKVATFFDKKVITPLSKLILNISSPVLSNTDTTDL